MLMLKVMVWDMTCMQEVRQWTREQWTMNIKSRKYSGFNVKHDCQASFSFDHELLKHSVFSCLAKRQVMIVTDL